MTRYWGHRMGKMLPLWLPCSFLEESDWPLYETGCWIRWTPFLIQQGCLCSYFQVHGCAANMWMGLQPSFFALFCFVPRFSRLLWVLSLWPILACFSISCKVLLTLICLSVRIQIWRKGGGCVGRGRYQIDTPEICSKYMPHSAHFHSFLICCL